MALLDAEYSMFGVAAVYTPKGGDPVSVTVAIDEGEDLAENGGMVRHVVKIKVRQSEVSARPDYWDAFVLTDGAGNSQTFRIVDGGVMEIRTFGPLGGEWACVCSTNERIPL